MIHLISILSFAIIIATAIAWSPQPSPSINSRRRVLQSAITTRQTISSITTALFSTTNTPSTSSTTAVDETYYTSSAAPNTGGVGAASSNNNAQKITLTRWLSTKVQDYPELRDMESLHLSISNLIHSSSTSKLSSSSSPFNNNSNNNSNNLRDNSMKRLDQLSKNVLQNALRFTGRLRVVEAPRSNPNSRDEEGPKEHQPGVTIAYALDQYGKVRFICLHDICCSILSVWTNVPTSIANGNITTITQITRTCQVDQARWRVSRCREVHSNVWIRFMLTWILATFDSIAISI